MPTITALPRAAADERPYTAYVIADGAEIVAGPEHRYYATDRLSRGTAVEVYREEASGWLAIRPPEGSFSWTPAEFIERLDDDKPDGDKLGRVRQSIGAWIGTSVEHVDEHYQQVKLKAGELVQILGEKTITSAGGTEATWLKIAPPAGEYRWIHLRDVSRQEPVELPPPMTLAAAMESAEPEPTMSEPRRIELPGEGLAIHELPTKSPPIGTGVALAQYRATAPAARPSLSPDGFVPRKRREGDATSTSLAPSTKTATGISPARSPQEPAARIATSIRPRTDAARSSSITPGSITPGSGNALRATSAATPIGNLSPDEVARQLDQLEIDLSLMLAQDRSQWNLAALKQRSTTLVESGSDPASRGRARLLLDKISRFEDAFEIPAGPVNRAGEVAATKAASDVPDPLADPRYDAQGWLKPVVSRKGDKTVAPFAVVDAEGEPVCFVSPSPGLNLNRYVNQPIGLYGRRGYLEQFKKPHVVAERVIVLDNKVR
jgi:hypothetical protein